jgi:ABC-type transport system involved in multi-copper enzyme maturation permease subunit
MTGSLINAASRAGRSRTLSIARYTLLEARRNRFLWAVSATVILIAMLSLLARQLAITESDRVQAVFFSAASRAALVFVVCIYVLQGLFRDFQDKVLDLVLSFDMPRWQYVLGKFCGHFLLGSACAAIAALPLLLLVDAGRVAAWACSLAMELWIVSAAAMFCVTAFSQLLPAASFVLGFYLLARSIAAIQLMSRSTLSAPGGETELMSGLADALALVLPRLDTFTQTAWLVDAAALPASAPALLAQTGVFVAMLLAAAMIDLHRRNL